MSTKLAQVVLPPPIHEYHSQDGNFAVSVLLWNHEYKKNCQSSFMNISEYCDCRLGVGCGWVNLIFPKESRNKYAFVSLLQI